MLKRLGVLRGGNMLLQHFDLCVSEIPDMAFQQLQAELLALLAHDVLGARLGGGDRVGIARLEVGQDVPHVLVVGLVDDVHEELHVALVVRCADGGNSRNGDEIQHLGMYVGHLVGPSGVDDLLRHGLDVAYGGVSCGGVAEPDDGFLFKAWRVFIPCRAGNHLVDHRAVNSQVDQEFDVILRDEPFGDEFGQCVVAFLEGVEHGLSELWLGGLS